MNILVVCEYGLYRNLTFSFVHAQAKEYVRLGHRVRVLVPIALGKRDWSGSRLSQKSRIVDGVELIPLRHPSLSIYGKGWFNTPSALFALRGRLSTLLTDFSPDLIHAHALGPDIVIGTWLKEKLGCPLVVTSHGETGCQEPWMSDPTAIKNYADKADVVVCVSSGINRCMDAANVAAPHQVILNGFAVEHVKAPIEKLPFSLVQVSHLIDQKRVNITVEAFRLLKQQYPSATLTLLGEGPERRALEKQCDVGGIKDSVHFTGQVPNSKVLSEMGRARFFVMPSVHEGFGIVYLEAMASGCVTIGTEGEGIADLIVNGENGFLVPPDDPQAIVDVIEWCLQNPEQADVIAERGRQDALGLTWEKNAESYLSLFMQLLSGNG